MSGWFSQEFENPVKLSEFDLHIMMMNPESYSDITNPHNHEVGPNQCTGIMVVRIDAPKPTVLRALADFVQPVGGIIHPLLKNYFSNTTLHALNQHQTLVVESYIADIPPGFTHPRTCSFIDTYVVGSNLSYLAKIVAAGDSNPVRRRTGWVRVDL